MVLAKAIHLYGNSAIPSLPRVLRDVDSFTQLSRALSPQDILEKWNMSARSAVPRYIPDYGSVYIPDDHELAPFMRDHIIHEVCGPLSAALTRRIPDLNRQILDDHYSTVRRILDSIEHGVVDPRAGNMLLRSAQRLMPDEFDLNGDLRNRLQEIMTSAGITAVVATLPLAFFAPGKIFPMISLIAGIMLFGIGASLNSSDSEYYMPGYSRSLPAYAVKRAWQKSDKRVPWPFNSSCYVLDMGKLPDGSDAAVMHDGNFKQYYVMKRNGGRYNELPGIALVKSNTTNDDAVYYNHNRYVPFGYAGDIPVWVHDSENGPRKRAIPCFGLELSDKQETRQVFIPNHSIVRRCDGRRVALFAQGMLFPFDPDVTEGWQHVRAHGYPDIVARLRSAKDGMNPLEAGIGSVETFFKRQVLFWDRENHGALAFIRDERGHAWRVNAWLKNGTAVTSRLTEDAAFSFDGQSLRKIPLTDPQVARALDLKEYRDPRKLWTQMRPKNAYLNPEAPLINIDLTNEFLPRSLQRMMSPNIVGYYDFAGQFEDHIINIRLRSTLKDSVDIRHIMSILASAPMNLLRQTDEIYIEPEDSLLRGGNGILGKADGMGRVILFYSGKNSGHHDELEYTVYHELAHGFAHPALPLRYHRRLRAAVMRAIELDGSPGFTDYAIASFSGKELWEEAFTEAVAYFAVPWIKRLRNLCIGYVSDNLAQVIANVIANPSWNPLQA